MANVEDTEGVSGEDKKPCVEEKAVVVSRTGKKLSSKAGHSQVTPDEDGCQSPDFYSDWYFEMKDLEKLKFRRGVLGIRHGNIINLMKALQEEQVDEENWLLPETFQLKMLCKKNTKLKVIMAISLENVKIKIDPDSESGGRPTPKGLGIPVTYDAGEIVACDIQRRKSRNRIIFRMTNYALDDSGGTVYENKEFECDADIAYKIVEKMYGIFEVRTSPIREEYLVSVHSQSESNRVRRILSFAFR